MATVFAAKPPAGYPVTSAIPLPPEASQQFIANNRATTEYTGDGAISNTEHFGVITKGSAAAMTLAAPVAVTDDGMVIVLTAGSAFAHVITATSGVIVDGTTGAKVTITMAAFLGASVTLRAWNAKWHLIGKTVATVA